VVGVLDVDLSEFLEKAQRAPMNEVEYRLPENEKAPSNRAHLLLRLMPTRRALVPKGELDLTLSCGHLPQMDMYYLIFFYLPLICTL
jgi:hypothetical protein